MEHRLSPEAYRQLVKLVGYQPTQPRDGVDAAYKLGIQHVLKIVREHLVHA